MITKFGYVASDPRLNVQGITVFDDGPKAKDWHPALFISIILSYVMGVTFFQVLKKCFPGIFSSYSSPRDVALGQAETDLPALPSAVR